MSIKDMLDSEIVWYTALVTLFVFLAVFIVVIFCLKLKNRKIDFQSPLEKKYAKIVSKRNALAQNVYGGSLVLFQFDDGSRQELFVDFNTASTMAENDFGNLTYQGRKFISFERRINN